MLSGIHESVLGDGSAAALGVFVALSDGRVATVTAALGAVAATPRRLGREVAVGAEAAGVTVVMATGVSAVAATGAGAWVAVRALRVAVAADA